MNIAELDKKTAAEKVRKVTGKIGDYGRTKIEEYHAKIAAADPGEVAAAYAAIVGQEPEQPQQAEEPAADPGEVAAEHTAHRAIAQAAAPAVPAGAAAQLLALIQQLAPKAEGIDAAQVRAIVAPMIDAAAMSMPAREITITTPAGSVEIAERTHPMFEKVLRLVGAGLNVLLVGPAGSGKTHLCSQLAQALKRTFGTLHCTAGASESQLTGWLLPVGDSGRFEFVPAQFATLYQEGESLFLMDEIDAADPNMLMVLNGALANGHLHIPQNFKQPEIKRGPNASIIAAANTYGTGGDFVYSGRNQLDGATLDRFYVVTIDYDTALEAELTGRRIPTYGAWSAASTKADDVRGDVQSLANWLDGIRSRAAAAKLRRVISTRCYQKAMAARAAGVPVSEIKADLLMGWTKDELSKVGQ